MKKFIVLFAVLAMVFAFAPTAMADVSMYGSARFQTFTVNVDNTGAAFDDRDTEWQMASLGRFGAKFTGGDVSGLWEVDFRNGTASNANDTSGLGLIRIRHMYGTWNFGSGQLLIGQTWPLMDMLISGNGYLEAGLQWYGGVGYVAGRISQIRLTFGNLAIAFLTPRIPSAAVGVWGSSDVDITLPKIEVRYDMALDNIKLAFAGGWQEYEEVNATDQSKDVSSMALGAMAKMNFDAFYVNLAAHYGENVGNYGLGASVVMDDAVSNGAGDIEDVTTWGAVLVLGYKVSDTVTVEAGFGHLESEADNYAAAGAKMEDTAKAYYINVPIKLAPGVLMKPEITVLDRDDNKIGATTTEEAKTTAIGVFWMINFK